MINTPEPNRREALKAMAGGIAATCLSPGAVHAAEPTSGLGLVVYCCATRRGHLRRENPEFDLYQPSAFLEHAVALGAGGVQVPLGVMEPADARALRRKAEDAGRYVEAIVRVPGESKDLERFEAEVRTAVEAGALAARTTVIPGRRYEFFDSLEKFREYERRAYRSAELAAPVCEKHRMPLAIENHKDQRDADRVALLKHIGSEYVGACVDTGNSFALLEDPLGTVTALAPWAHSVHLKDQALQLYDEGFLLADIPLGQGGLDLKAMVVELKKAKPEIRFTLELITRDPLRVPCLTEKYWATFPDLPGRELARTLRYARDHTTEELQYPSKLSPVRRLALEDGNVKESLRYARQELGI